MQYLFEQAIVPRIIPKGREVMVLCAEHVTVKDSLNFLPMPLSALPAAFGLKELKKGFFPYLVAPGVDYIRWRVACEGHVLAGPYETKNPC